MAYTLKNWYLLRRDRIQSIRNDDDPKNGEWYSAIGHVYGRPGWSDGKMLLSSEIMGMEIGDKAVIIHTRNSDYLCAAEDHSYPLKDVEALTVLLGSEAVQMIEEAAGQENDASVKDVLSKLPKEQKNAVLFILSASADYYFEAMLLLREGQARYVTSYLPHVGTFQDSIMIRDEREIYDFRYLPMPGGVLQFYMWDDHHGPVYVYNKGGELLKVLCPAGTFEIDPGHVTLMDKMME